MRIDSFSDGVRRPAEIFAQMVQDTPLSGTDGIASVDVNYRSELPMDTLFEVGAYHPEFGTDYLELSLEELQTLAADEIVFDLERGEVVTGRVVDAGGNPLRNVEVRLYTTHLPKDVGLSGIGTFTHADGTFRIAGIRFNNVPTLATGTYPGGTQFRSQRRGRFKVRITKEQFDEATKEWTLGDITIKDVR